MPSTSGSKRVVDEQVQTIEYLDQIRAGIIPTKDIQQKVGGSDVEKAKRYLDKELRKIPATHGRLGLIVQSLTIIKVVILAYFTIFVTVLLLLYTGSVPTLAHALPLIGILKFLLSPPLPMIMFLVVSLFVLLRYYTHSKLESMGKDTIAPPEGKRKNIKEAVERHIKLLRDELTVQGLDPKKARLKLHHNDYIGIKIAADPMLLRNAYIAEVCCD
jgi:hypothetical protein